MKRAIQRFPQKEYDVAIIGGGIYGAFAAWDASLRGLSVALVEQDDFCGATSANSHKIIHGGLRYLQQFDLRRMRESIRERSALLRIAPHLIRVMPCLVPTFGFGVQSKTSMALALAFTDAIGFDRNRYLHPARQIPRGRILTKAELRNYGTGLERSGASGAALFFDAQVHSPERLTLAVLQGASNSGADLGNYVKVIGFIREPNGGRILGLKAVDRIAGNPLEIRARMVLNCSGPWGGRILEMAGSSHAPKLSVYKAMVLVTRQLFRDVAVGIPATTRFRDRDAVLNKGYRLFFVTPWRDRSLIGTYTARFDGDPDDVRLSEWEIEQFVAEFRKASPASNLERRDVSLAYGGLLPGSVIADDVQAEKHYRIVNHEEEDGLRGLITVIGVKFTTARDVAERAVDLLLRQLGRPPQNCRTSATPVAGGTGGPPEAITPRASGVPSGIVRRWVETYGADYEHLLPYAAERPDAYQPLPGSEVTTAEVIHAVRAEIACRLSDVVVRRTDLGTAGYPGDACVQSCATIMAAELGWNDQQIEQEVHEVKRHYSGHGYQKWASLVPANAS